MSEKIISHFKAPLPKLGENVEGYVLAEGGKQVGIKDARCVLSQRGAASALGIQGGGGIGFPRTLDTQSLKNNLHPSLIEEIKNPIKFSYIQKDSKAKIGKIIHGYDTSLFIKIATSIVELNSLGKLHPAQEKLAENAIKVLMVLANTTLNSLIYQESGYWISVEGQLISNIIDRYLKDYTNRWSKRFPDELWILLIKIKGYPSYMAIKRPAFVGHWVNDIVYSRLAPGIRRKLNKLNPRDKETGRRLKKHHQFLTENHGVPELEKHLREVIGLMKVANDEKSFQQMLNKLAPKYGDTLDLPF